MASVNKVFLIGNLTRDVELNVLPTGSPVGEFGIAMNRKWKDKNTQQDKEEVCFADVTVWGSQAENMQKYTKKGSSVHIEGHLQLDQWVDQQSGQNRSKLKVIAEKVTFLDSVNNNQQNTVVVQPVAPSQLMPTPVIQQPVQQQQFVQQPATPQGAPPQVQAQALQQTQQIPTPQQQPVQQAQQAVPMQPQVQQPVSGASMMGDTGETIPF